MGVSLFVFFALGDLLLDIKSCGPPSNATCKVVPYSNSQPYQGKVKSSMSHMCHDQTVPSSMRNFRVYPSPNQALAKRFGHGSHDPGQESEKRNIALVLKHLVANRRLDIDKLTALGRPRARRGTRGSAAHTALRFLRVPLSGSDSDQSLGPTVSWTKDMPIRGI